MPGKISGAGINGQESRSSGSQAENNFRTIAHGKKSNLCDKYGLGSREDCLFLNPSAEHQNYLRNVVAAQCYVPFKQLLSRLR